jgi:vacuolar-type H+-ATPase subunit E/Vma4
MGLDKVVDNIRAEGRSASQSTVANARKEADAILADAKRQADEVRAKRAGEATAAAEALLKRESANADLEARRLRLAAERELVASLRSELEKRLAALPESQREVHLKSLVARANVPNGKVWVAKQDEKLAQRAGLKIAGTFEGLGGVIVEAADGATRENLRYETLLDEIWSGSTAEVANLLKA